MVDLEATISVLTAISIYALGNWYAYTQESEWINIRGESDKVKEYLYSAKYHTSENILHKLFFSLGKSLARNKAIKKYNLPSWKHL